MLFLQRNARNHIDILVWRAMQKPFIKTLVSYDFPWFPVKLSTPISDQRLKYPHIITIGPLLMVNLHKSHQSSHQSSPLDPHLIHIWSTFPRLLELGIKPIFVFDGEAPEMKSHARSSSWELLSSGPRIPSPRIHSRKWPIYMTHTQTHTHTHIYIYIYVCIYI